MRQWPRTGPRLVRGLCSLGGALGGPGRGGARAGDLESGGELRRLEAEQRKIRLRSSCLPEFDWPCFFSASCAPLPARGPHACSIFHPPAHSIDGECGRQIHAMRPCPASCALPALVLFTAPCLLLPACPPAVEGLRRIMSEARVGGGEGAGADAMADAGVLTQAGQVSVGRACCSLDVVPEASLPRASALLHALQCALLRGGSFPGLLRLGGVPPTFACSLDS